MEEMGQLAIGELRREGLSDSLSEFMLDHGPIVQSHIQNHEIS